MPAARASDSAYVFLGTEIGRRNDAIADVRKKLSSRGGAPEETVFYAGETEAMRIAEAIRNHSLFASARLFVVRNAEAIKKKEDAALIVSCMEELDGDTAMILVSDEFKLIAALDNCCPRENRVVFYEMFENQKPDWVRSFFRKNGRTVSADGIDTILEMVENNTDALSRECQRLMLFLPADRQIEAEDVEKWLSHNREENAFTLFSRIAAGDVPRAAETLHTLLAAKERPAGILAALASCFRKLRDYHALAREGKLDNAFELKKIGISAPKAKSDYAAAFHRYSAHAADFCLALTAEYDVLTRASGTALESVLMDVYVLKVMARGGTT